MLNKPFVGLRVSFSLVVMCVFVSLYPLCGLIIRRRVALRADELFEIVKNVLYLSKFDVLNVSLCRKARIGYLNSLINSGYSYAP